jgi:hypothetical protein
VTQRMMTERSLAESWREMLDRYRWSCYCTLTYDAAVHRDRCRRDFTDTFIRRLARFAQQPVPWFFAIQSARGADRPHIHALLGGTESLDVSQIAATWRFGYTRVRLYDRSRSASGYVSREILEWSDDHDLSNRLPALLHSRSQSQSRSCAAA